MDRFAPTYSRHFTWDAADIFKFPNENLTTPIGLKCEGVVCGNFQRQNGRATDR
jgi:hypothetical protein